MAKGEDENEVGSTLTLNTVVSILARPRIKSKTSVLSILATLELKQFMTLRKKK